MSTNHIIRNIEYLPKPNYLETFITTDLPNLATTFGSFCFIFDDQNRLLLSHLKKRGWDLPGGKKEPQDEENTNSLFEALIKTAVRETYEETKVKVKDLQYIGYRLFHVDNLEQNGVKAFNHNDTYCLYFFGRVDSLDNFEFETQENGAIERAFYNITDPEVLKLHPITHHISLWEYIINNLIH